MMVYQDKNLSDPFESCSSIGREYDFDLKSSESAANVIVFNIVLNIVLMLTASLGNGMIIVAILRSQNLQTPSYLLITSLAFTDLLMGLVFHPLQIVLCVYNLHADVQGICSMAKVFLFSVVYLGFVSLFMVTCISIDRYLAVTLRHRYNIIVTKKRVHRLISSVWIVTLFIAFPTTIENTYNIYIYYILGSCLGSALALITCIFYTKSFRSLHLYTVQVQAKQPNPLACNFDVAKYKKTLKTMLIVLGCFLLCFVPATGVTLARLILGSREKLMVLGSLSLTLMGLNSSINPVIYLIRFKDIRRACRQRFSGAPARAESHRERSTIS